MSTKVAPSSRSNPAPAAAPWVETTIVRPPGPVKEHAARILDRCRGEGPANCVNRCPLHVDARSYVQLAKEGKYQEALRKVREKLPFPGVLGYVCAHPCELHCKRVDEDDPIRIRDIKRFLADHEEGPPQHILDCAPDRSQRVAVVGAGPAGLIAAHDLRRAGFKVTVFERDSSIGGCLVSRIPDYRLPKRVVDRDLSVIDALGIDIRLDVEIGDDIALEQLREDFDAVLLLVGYEGGVDLLRATGDIFPRSARGTVWVDPVTAETALPGVFAGGDAVSGPSTVINSLGFGRRTAESAIRFLDGKNLHEDREDPLGSRLLWTLEIDDRERQRRVRQPVMLTPHNEAMTSDQVTEESERCLDCECGLCVKDCEFLSKYCESPKELARDVLRGMQHEDVNKMAYSCNLCELCKTVCPEDLDTGAMLQKTRNKAVVEDHGPRPEHKPILSYWKAGVSKLFTITMPPPGRKRAKRLFFAGCGLPIISPQNTVYAYERLREIHPDTGVMMKCCGAPVEFLGHDDLFTETTDMILREMEELGADELVPACPDCAHSLRHKLPDHIKITPIWEYLAGEWHPDKNRTGETVSIHDSCKARHMPGVHGAVRTLLGDSGTEIEDIEYSKDKARCCGFGGMIYPVDTELSQNITKRRADESPHPMITYCAGCRMALRSSGKDSIHILDFLTSDDWQATAAAPPPGGLTRYLNRLKTKWGLKRLKPLDGK